MNNVYIWIWTGLIFGSILWYFYLLFHVGWRGGRDILTMVRELSRLAAEAEQDESDGNK